MRRIDHIVLHCTATPTNTTVASILRYWRNVLGWKNPGYHYLVQRNGHINLLLPIDRVANGVRGYNAHGIHISYIGGIDGNKRPVDNRTWPQRESMEALVRTMLKLFPDATVKGHRDFPGVHKDCPSYNVAEWMKSIGL